MSLLNNLTSSDPNAGKATAAEGMSFNQLMASLATGMVFFGIFFWTFYLMRQKYRRIYAPTTYLVPERQRFDPPPHGWFAWIKPVFETKRKPFVEKCGLDAYCFVRLLFMEIKIFLPLMVVVLPVVIPLNVYGIDNPGNSGLDEYGWGNLSTTHTGRYTGHLVMAVVVLVWVCYVFYTELLNYIQERQRWMTSPSHRIRASATTVLVSNIPDKWCNVDALDALFDAFPGGIRNIWINRDYGDLLDKKNKQLEIARRLESAETALIRNCKRKALQMRKREEKVKGTKKTQEQRDADDAHDQRTAEAMANDAGITVNSPNVPHDIDEELDQAMDTHEDSKSTKSEKRGRLPIPFGQGLQAVGRGFGAVGHGIGRGFGAVGHGMEKFGQGTAEGVVKGFGRARYGIDKSFGAANPVGYVPEFDGSQEEFADNATQGGNLGPSKDHLKRHGTAPEKSHHGRSPRPNRDYLHRGSDGKRVASNGSPFTNGAMNSSPDVSRSRVRNNTEPPIEEEKDKDDSELHHMNPLRLFRRNSAFPSPEPFHRESDEFPLNHSIPQLDATGEESPDPAAGHSKDMDEITKAAETEEEKRQKDKYAKKPPIIDWDKYRAELERENASGAWTTYLTPKQRETMRLSLFPRCNWWWKIWPTWWFSFGAKVDVIVYCRLQLIELNKEIEEDEKNLDKFPLMNSAFIQFNHQVAAHMACQSITHHRPKNMGPRVLEIDPKDVIWDNLSTPWWTAYLKTALVIAIVIGIVILWAFPMAFVGLLSQLDSIADAVHWLRWVANLPKLVKSLAQGALPPALQAVLLLVLPMIIRLLVDFSGVSTGVEAELETQGYWFIFLFVQVFLVVTLSSGITSTIDQIINSPLDVPQILAENLPKGSNYFFSYLLLQALYGSAQQLVQLPQLFMWFVMGKILDDTARAKFNRQKTLPNTMWGTLFPVHTNFCCIVIIYSIITPFMLIFGTFVAALFWVVYRYNSFYVLRWSVDSGGLYFPRAVNQMFTGLYVMQLCLIGLFFLVRDQKGNVVCAPHAIVMIVTLILTVIYQYMLNKSLGPLFKFVPITMEDEAQERQEAFEAALAKKWEELEEEEHEKPGEISSTSLREKSSAIELQDLENQRPPTSRNFTAITNASTTSTDSRPKRHSRHHRNTIHQHQQPPPDPEIAKTPQTAGYLFEGYHDELEDLTPDERDVLVRKAFEHAALRMTKPCIWIPRDEFGISDDEIKHTAALSDTLPDEDWGIWITNQYTALDAKARVIFRRPPPDFNSAEEFMQL
ncbi:phosphate metabolism protein [Diplodia corticola]|uniref:Phosphate metabolism protein n=1 Tax=Diplodia corticola TaxID=236234 RepID=A0A1J9SCC3_9PEZI|nr:phosphate metabolism protein [Diplodia corticola]OJD37492.1 phosphate metabolism protein [Diplodia corticola]